MNTQNRKVSNNKNICYKSKNKMKKTPQKEAKWIPQTQINDRSFYWLGTSTSMQ